MRCVSPGAIRTNVVCMSLLTGCGGPQSALEPAGADAARVADLWWLLFAIATVVMASVTSLLLVALFRRRQRTEPQRSDDARLVRRIAGGVVFTFVALVVIFAATLRASRAGASESDATVRVRVTGLMWWWRVEYLDERSGVLFETANELRMPVGEPVLVELAAADVIHSLWIPRLGGKTDMIPGRSTRMILEATEPGVFRGQ